MNSKYSSIDHDNKIFAKNPRAWLILLLAFTGIVVSSYLSWTKFSNKNLLCNGLGDCNAVNSSVYAYLFDIPIAYLGLSMYTLIAILLLLDTKIKYMELTKLSIFGISLFGSIYSFWLTYVEVVIIEAICIYCIASAIIITSIFILSIYQLKNN